jgi:hypothetical protein
MLVSQSNTHNVYVTNGYRQINGCHVVFKRTILNELPYWILEIKHVLLLNNHTNLNVKF